MVTITIRDVPEHVRDELAARAARSGRSLQQYLLAELEDLAEHPIPDDWWAQVRERARSYQGSATTEDILSALREVRGE
jgi:antitoxin FitA